MAEIKDVFAKNLLELRKSNSLTQMELASKLNYSDKSVSKWERGDAVPDIEALANLAAFFGITVDYLITEHDGEIAAPLQKERKLKGNRLTIALLAMSAVWIISTIIYVQLLLWAHVNYWNVFVWSVPASCIVLIVFNAIWGRRRFSFVLTSILVWSLITAIYLEAIKYNMWVLYFIGIPLQISIILTSRLKSAG